MKDYLIYSSNLTDSLVFYRALFNRMPELLQPNEIRYIQADFVLTIAESPNASKETLQWIVSDRSELEKINERMSRFMRTGKMNNDCVFVRDAIGLIDPNGNKWIIGKPDQPIFFEKCYINKKSINMYNYGTI